MRVLSYFSDRPSPVLHLDGIGAQQHFRSDCDLNTIIKRYPDGVLPPPASRPVYGDFTAIGKGLQESMDALRFVSDWFASLPSEIRAKFGNDPLAAQRYVLDQPDEAVKLGILSASESAERASAASTAADKGGAAVASPTQPANPATPTSAPEGAA